jgi:hypothetical protein
MRDRDGVGRAPGGRSDDGILRGSGDVDHHGDAVTVEVEDARGGKGAVSRAHTQIAIDLDVDAHRAIVRRSAPDGGT